MGWVTTTFEEIKRPVSKRYTCTECGKRKGKSTTLCQTVNPFNKNPDGSVKTRAEISQELGREALAWKSVEADTCNPCWDALDREQRIRLNTEYRKAFDDAKRRFCCPTA